jgi:hypothetical protein
MGLALSSTLVMCMSFSMSWQGAVVLLSCARSTEFTTAASYGAEKIN